MKKRPPFWAALASLPASHKLSPSMNSSLKFSIARQDITPDYPVFQSGFGSRTRKSEGVLQPIYVKAVLLQANKTVLILAFDAMGGDRSFVNGLKDALRDRFGLQHDEVLLNFSHAHSSIYLTGLEAEGRQGIWSIGQDHCPADNVPGGFDADETYFLHLRELVLNLVGGCFENLTEGQAAIASAPTHFSISRRLPLENGVMAFAPNPDGEIDDSLTVIKLTEGEAVKGIVYIHGTHPTTLGDSYLLANDLISFSALELEREYPEAISVFLQGCGAEIKPLATVGEDGGFAPRDVPAVEKMGQQLAAEVSAILKEASFKTLDPHFKTALHSCTLPVAPDPIDFYRNIMTVDSPGGFEYSCAARMLAARLEGTAKKELPCFVAVWELDAETHIVGIEGEVSTGYSLAIKNYFNRGDMVVLGYTNGVPCYIPTAAMVGEGGYEAECNYFFGLQGRFVPEIEDIIVGQTAKLVHQVK